MPANATPAQLLVDLRRLARQRRAVPVAEVAPLLSRLLAACTSLALEERPNGLSIRLASGGPAPVLVACFLHRAPAAVLTDAERAVARELCAGLTRAQIARLRGVTPNTVKSQIRQIFRKLDIDSRVDLVRLVGP